MKDNRNVGALFGIGNDNYNDADDDGENFQTVALFNDLKNDVTRSASRLSTFGG